MPGKPTAVRGKHKRRYRAFISYCRADAACAEWLHRALERYRIPVQLRRSHAVPAGLFPIFRDREEFAAAGDLHAGIIDALGRSDALIVICSPHAAVSRWVDEEVRCFRRLAPDRPVLVLIVAGERKRPKVPGRVYQQMEIEVGPFQRQVRLAEDVDPTHARASLEHGVLTVELPVADVAPPPGSVAIEVWLA